MVQKLIKKAFFALVVSPFFFVYGLLVMVRLLLGASRSVSKLRAGMRDSVRCPHGHENRTVGRWRCGGCGGAYLGWVGACTVCRAGADWISCAECGVAVRLPWSGR